MNTQATTPFGDDDQDGKLERARTAIIRYPRFRELHELICECQRVSRGAQEPQCMALEGVTGAGKSTLVREYVAAFPPSRTKTRTCIPVFYLETPSPVTVKGMASALLHALGDPLWDRGTQTSMDKRLLHLLRQCQVELIILDDFHHLIDPEKKWMIVKVANWLKVLIKESNIPVLVVAIEGSIKNILGEVDNHQLSRLFLVRETLAPFPWKPNEKQTIQNFNRFVELAEKAVDIPIAISMERISFLYRVHCATNGVVANVMNLMRYAQVHAVRRKSACIELADLSHAYKKRLMLHIGRPVDPFAD